MANNSQIGAIHVEASIGTAKFVQGAQKLRSEAKKTETALKGSFSSMGVAVRGFAGAMTAGLSIGLLGGLAKRAIDFAKNIGVVAKQLNVTTKELQTFRFAAEQMGVKNAEADKALERLGVTLGKAAAGSTSATKALGAVGVSLNDIQTKSRTEIFGQIADQMNRQGGAAKNAAAANAIFGESASKLTPLLDQGSRGINELSLAAERLGIVLSDSQIQQADETARKLEAVKTVLEAQIAGVVADNAASIVTLANALATLTSSIVNFLGSNPQAALAILGALAGSRFGVPGAAAGGLAGLFAGGRMAAGRDASSSDVAFLKNRLREEANQLKGMAASARKAEQRGGSGVPLGAQIQKVQQLHAALNRAQATAAAPIVGGAAIPQFLAPSGGGGRRTRTPRAPRDRSDDVAFQFDQEMRRAEMDTLRALQSLSHDYVERANIAVQLLDLQRQEQQAELDNRVRRAERDFAEGKIDAATLEQAKTQAAQLSLEYDKQLRLEKQAVADQVELDRQQEFNRLEAVNFDIQRQMLEGEARLAETAAERRDVELRILDLAYREEKERLERIIRESKDWAEIEEARRRLAALPGLQDQARAGVIASTRGPWEDWMAQLPTTAAKAQEALERLQVQGMEGLLDATLALSEGLDSAKDALLDTLKQFLLGLARMHGQAWMGSLLPQSGGLFGSLGSIFGASGGATGPVTSPPISGDWIGPRMAGGGGFTIKGFPGIDRNLLSINGIPVAAVSYNERIGVTPANDRGVRAPGRGDVHMTVITPNADSFRRSEGQITRGLRRKLG